LLLGGYDRGIDYSQLIHFLNSYPVSTVIFLGNAGKKMRNLWEVAGNKNDKKNYWFDDLRPAVICAVENTPAGEKLLLSPAAASYDMFKNFEERGKTFHEILKSLVS
ncbi:MAG: UDP-N-acetylmuramoyl-L-alanine--D-glutamate ligase, partial [Bacteroidota bacterium]